MPPVIDTASRHRREIVTCQDVTRRQFVRAGASLALLLVAGCGTEGGAASTTMPTRRVVPHKFGETEVPLNPQRVVSVGWDEHDLILTFGVVPVMQRDSWGEQPFGTWPWAQPALGEAEPIVFTDEMPFEDIAAAKPDLIMATWAGIDQATYDLLAEIAPTVAQHPEYEDWETPWDARALQVGSVFGKVNEAQALIDGITARIMEIAEAHPEWQQMEAVAVTVDDSLAVAVEGHSRGKLLLDLGFQIPAEIVEAAGEESHALISFEKIDMIDQDLIIWVHGDDDASPIRDLPLRTTLRAHTEGREVYCDKVLTAAFSIQSPLSYAYLLDALVPEIERAVDGDPSTQVEKAVEYELVG